MNGSSRPIRPYPANRILSDGQAVVSILERGFKWLGLELYGALVAVEVYHTQDYLKQPDLLMVAHSLVQ